MDVERGIAIDMCSTFQYFEHAQFQLLNRMYSLSIYVKLLSGKQIPDTGAGGSARSRPLSSAIPPDCPQRRVAQRLARCYDHLLARHLLILSAAESLTELLELIRTQVWAELQAQQTISTPSGAPTTNSNPPGMLMKQTLQWACTYVRMRHNAWFKGHFSRKVGRLKPARF